MGAHLGSTPVALAGRGNAYLGDTLVWTPDGAAPPTAGSLRLEKTGPDYMSTPFSEALLPSTSFEARVDLQWDAYQSLPGNAYLLTLWTDPSSNAFRIYHNSADRWGVMLGNPATGQYGHGRDCVHSTTLVGGTRYHFRFVWKASDGGVETLKVYLRTDTAAELSDDTGWSLDGSYIGTAVSAALPASSALTTTPPLLLHPGGNVRGLLFYADGALEADPNFAEDKWSDGTDADAQGNTWTASGPTWTWTADA